MAAARRGALVVHGAAAAGAVGQSAGTAGRRLPLLCGGAHRSKITKKVHKPPRNHYIEWPVFSDIGLNCESQGEKGRTCKRYKILIGS